MLNPAMGLPVFTISLTMRLVQIRHVFAGKVVHRHLVPERDVGHYRDGAPAANRQYLTITSSNKLPVKI